MTKWMSGARGMAVIVLLWIVGWGMGFGGLIELLIDPDGEILDVWPTAMAAPGLLGGIVFAVLVRVAEGRRRFDEVALVRFTAWGVLTGLALGVFAIATDATNVEGLDLTDAETVGILTALGGVAAFGTAVFFRLLTWFRPATVAGQTR